jgi:pSer/pThr/pTyr-binding forkhead associated (FHA) protein
MVGERQARHMPPGVDSRSHRGAVVWCDGDVPGEGGSELPRHQASPAELQERLEAERRGEPFLVFFDDAGRQRLVELDAVERPRVTVGRGATDVRLDWDSDVSRLHAELEHLGGCWTVADDGLSRNGTYLNGQRLRGRSRLAERDRLRFGSTTVVYRAPAAVAPVDVATTTLPTDPADLELSPAQRRVLIALARPCVGRGATAAPATNRDIAAELHLSVDTVKTHLRAIAMKFDVDALPQNAKRTRLVELALQTGAISEQDVTPL